ncbi:hypothetical protein [Alkaliphilus sp. B6464]|uniref:hypothetical protein n=1 Tax=Alkaliphilus sp. B6464 TaxID=2731219 RepID=UPI001BA8F86C|nr:hypothetical protein [Alkaliphilus sp. B6464]QUH18450.1 hypothetical protein HYG84_00070 [Alkaliphilus sp. B6464]
MIKLSIRMPPPNKKISLPSFFFSSRITLQISPLIKLIFHIWNTQRLTISSICKQLKTQRIPTVGIKTDYSEINLEELERIFKEIDIKFFYIMPRYHNPLGYSLSQKDKQEILKLADKYDVYIV